ncbi:MAG: Ycf66 family protein [Microcystaceae cyanobacterium]
MLAYFLAIALALASLFLYLSAFLARDIHRQDDFLWSGVGLFYALILWICAGQVRGSILLGQGAAVALVLSFGWQTIQLRRAIANPDQPIDTEGFSVMAWLKERFFPKKSPSVPPKAESPSEAVTEAPPQPTETEKEDSTPVVKPTPTEEEMIVEEEEEIVMTESSVDVAVAEEIPDDNSLDDILEDLEEDSKDETIPTASDTTLKETLIEDLEEKQGNPTVSETTLKETLIEDLEEKQEEEGNPIVSEATLKETLIEDLEEKQEEEGNPTVSEAILDEDSFDFEPYISDNDAETVIESYTPPTINPVVTETEKSEETIETKEDKGKL